MTTKRGKFQQKNVKNVMILQSGGIEG